MLLSRRRLWMLVLLFMGGIVGSCSQYDLEDVGQAEDPAGKPTAQHGWSGAAVRSGSSDFRKIVALVPVRDEAHMLPSCLRALSPFVDATVVLDDCSTDGSAIVAQKLAAECKVERVERSPNCPVEDGGDSALPYWGNEAGHRGFLLELGRSVGGTHFLAIDADEAIVAGAGGGSSHDFRETFLHMQPGDLLVMHYMTMWRSTTSYRGDKGDMKAVGFVDQPGAHFARGRDPLHINRVPRMPHHGTAYELKNNMQHGGPPHTAVLHFGFSSLRNARLKNAVYNMFDVKSGTSKTRGEMNRGFYDQGLTAESEERVVRESLLEAPAVWWESIGPAFNHSAFDVLSEWRERKILKWLTEGLGPGQFDGLEAMRALQRHDFHTIESASERRRTVQMLGRLGPSIPTTK